MTCSVTICWRLLGATCCAECGCGLFKGMTSSWVGGRTCQEIIIILYPFRQVPSWLRARPLESVVDVSDLMRQYGSRPVSCHTRYDLSRGSVRILSRQCQVQAWHGERVTEGRTTHCWVKSQEMEECAFSFLSSLGSRNRINQIVVMFVLRNKLIPEPLFQGRARQQMDGGRPFPDQQPAVSVKVQSQCCLFW